MAEPIKAKRIEGDEVEITLRPGSGVQIVDRWEDVKRLYAGIVTSSSQCDEGRFNVRLMHDIHDNRADKDLPNIRTYRRGMTFESNEQYLIVPHGIDWPLLQKPSPAKSAK